mmetsp:Transcript_8676/g.13085  ORF Transcript_8676/g.13085 Transcript_8676/m.13085 type:complete len:113 (+) Transcript_8676:1031-1369(+)
MPLSLSSSSSNVEVDLEVLMSSYSAPRTPLLKKNLKLKLVHTARVPWMHLQRTAPVVLWTLLEFPPPHPAGCMMETKQLKSIPSAQSQSCNNLKMIYCAFAMQNNSSYGIFG